MRQPTRIVPAFLTSQIAKRKDISETPGDSQNSIPALRARVTLLEEILSTRRYEAL